MNAAAGCLLATACALAAPQVASAGPSLRADPHEGAVGDPVTLHGRGWNAGVGCATKVVLYFKQGSTRMKLGAASHGGGTFDFDTHYQRAAPGGASFVARQGCADRVYKRVAFVTIGGDESVRYRGRTEAGGRVRFVVVDGNEVGRFRFVNRCSVDLDRGSAVPGPMPIGDISFSRHGRRFTIFGRFREGGRVRGHARERADGCDSGSLSWTAHRTD